MAEFARRTEEVLGQAWSLLDQARDRLEAATRTLPAALLIAQLGVVTLALGVVSVEQRTSALVVACDGDLCTPASAASDGEAPATAGDGSPSAQGDAPQFAVEAPSQPDGQQVAAPRPAAGEGPADSEAATDGAEESAPRSSGGQPATDVDGQAMEFPADEKKAGARRSRAQRQPEARRMPYGHYAAHAPELIGALPTLEALQRHLPPSVLTRDVAAQKARIAWLDERAEVTVDGFENFTVDTRFNDAFADLPKYHDRIRPKLFLVHWTAVGYNDVEHFISSLRPYRVQYFLDRQARVYELFEADHHKPAHALGANDFAQGVEIETGPFDGSESPLYSYTPDQIEQTVYLAVDFLRRNGLPVDETTLVGHYAADLIFSNPYYRPHSGELLQPKVRKFDPPQELMQVIVAKARALDAALDA